MKTQKLFMLWLCTATFVTFTSNAAEKAADESDDAIVASFERELNREPTDPQHVARKDVDDDVLYLRISKPLQSPDLAKAPAQEEGE